MSNSNLDATIQKQRIRAPKAHGNSLVIPPREAIPQFWSLNRKTLSQHRFEIAGIPIQTLRHSARSKLIEDAIKYTSQYTDPGGVRGGGFVLSGHQPRLFHPGVWFKNFSLNDLAKQFQANAINLIIDNDLCGLSSVTVPRRINETEATTETIPYDRVGGNIPFEARFIEDRDVFSRFSKKISESIGDIVTEPIVHRLWDFANSYTDPNNRLGHTIAAARHQLELEKGLSTLEVPLSTVCKTTEFAGLITEILTRIDEFQETYNQSLNEYRQVHRIRSQTHPVPALVRQNDWIETPFWIWSSDAPTRRTLFVKKQAGKLVISDLAAIQQNIASSDLVAAIHELNQGPIAIRPKALITTMYSRMVLSDLFIHGIGGSKYDQLTDAIMIRFWKSVPPVFATMTATMKLPFEFEPVFPIDVSNERSLRREYQFHPEVFVDNLNPSIERIITEKKSWISKSLPRGSRKERHDLIVSCNDNLQALTRELVLETIEREKQIRSRLDQSRILDSRAYSFCLFDESLIKTLAEMAAK